MVDQIANQKKAGDKESRNHAHLVVSYLFASYEEIADCQENCAGAVEEGINRRQRGCMVSSCDPSLLTQQKKRYHQDDHNGDKADGAEDQPIFHTTIADADPDLIRNLRSAWTDPNIGEQARDRLSGNGTTFPGSGFSKPFQIPAGV